MKINFKSLQTTLVNWLINTNPIKNTLRSMSLPELEAYIRGSSRSISGSVVNQEAALSHASVWACVMILSETISSLPINFYRKDNGKRVLVTGEPGSDLFLYGPNEYQVIDEWLEMALIEILIGSGNCVSLKINDHTGSTTELLPLVSKYLTIEKKNYDLAYHYNPPNGRKITFLPNEVLHLRGPSLDGLIGMNPIKYHRETIGAAISIRDHGSNFFSNGAVPLGLLSADKGTTIQESARAALLEDFNLLHKGNNNSHRVGFLPPGVNYTGIKISMEDSQYIEVNKYTRTQLAAIYRVPVYKIGDFEKATFNNIEHSNIDFVATSILPRVVKIESRFRRSLLPPEISRDHYYKFNLSGLLRGDHESRAKALQIMRQSGIISANEWRSIEDMNPRTDTGGDEYVIWSNTRPDSSD